MNDVLDLFSFFPPEKQELPTSLSAAERRADAALHPVIHVKTRGHHHHQGK
jgi:hypothetical protein